MRAAASAHAALIREAGVAVGEGSVDTTGLWGEAVEGGRGLYRRRAKAGVLKWREIHIHAGRRRWLHSDWLLYF